MKTAFKILLWGGGLVIVLGVIFGAYVYFAGKDIPPSDDSDLAIDIPVVPDDENAFVYLIKASQAAVLPEDFNWSPPAPLPDDTIDILALNQEAFDYIQKALDCSILAPPRNPEWGEMPNLHFISKLLYLDVHQAIAEKNLDQAIQKVSIRLDLARLEAENSLSLIQYLIARAYLNYALTDIVTVAQQPDITAEQLQQLAALFHRLPDQEHILRRTIKGEYQFAKTIMNDWGNPSNIPGEYRTLLRFGFLLNTTLRDYAQLMRDVLQSIPVSFEDIPPLPEAASCWYSWMIPNSKGRLVFEEIRHAVYIMVHLHVYDKAAQTAAETIVALHRYKQQHHVLPDSLEALVPDFLPAVPIDPYDEQPMRYHPEQNIIYFVGGNMTDDGGQGKRSYEVIHHRSEPDIVFDIDAFSPQPTKNNP